MAENLRPVAPIDLAFAEITPGAAQTPAPMIEWMLPTDILIDATYQRDPSPKSIALTTAIISGWDWRKFKPPIVAWTDAGFVCLDGQHTCIAAASHPDIDKIPMLVVEAMSVSDQAAAFIGHNRDRVAITPMQMHHAAVAAGDNDALTLEQVCARASIRLVRSAHGDQAWKQGDSVAIVAIKALIARRHAKGAREVLEVLAKSDRKPIGACEIRAVEWLLTDPEYAEQLEPEAVTEAINAATNADQDAKVNAKMLCIPLWKALAMAWFKKARKKRKIAA